MKRMASDLLMIAKDLMADWGDATLSDLRGGTQFVPTFHNGKSFIITHNGIYVRGSHGSEDFRLINIRHAVLELGLQGEGDVITAFQDCGGNFGILDAELKRTGKFYNKVVK